MRYVIDCSYLDPLDWEDEHDSYLAAMADRERDERKIEEWGDDLSWNQRIAREVL